MSDFETIPVVDISSLGGEDGAFHAEAVRRLRHAAEHVGFLYITGHGLPEPLLAALREAARDFFARPLDEKMAAYIGHSRNHRGYVPEGEEVFAGGTPDAKEAFDLSRDLPATDPDYLAGNPLLGPNQWPEGVAGFREAVTAYYEAAFALGQRMLRGFSEALGLPASPSRCPSSVSSTIPSTRSRTTGRASARIPTMRFSPYCCRPRRAWK